MQRPGQGGLNPSRERHNNGVFRRSVHLGLLACLFCTGGLAQTNDPVPKAADVPHLYRVEVVAQNLAAPWALDFLPDGRIFFTERFGQIRVIEQGKLLDVPALRLTNIAVGAKMGLLGLVHDPGFATNHFVYSAQNYPAGERFALRVVRYRESQNQLLEPRTIIEGIPAWLNHTGGRLRFGPDGMLYITTGDADHPPIRSASIPSPEKSSASTLMARFPPDNPFIGQTNARPEIWSYGHRNPQGIDFHPTLPLVMATEHGPDHGDEVNIIERGANYGWPRIHHRLAETGLRSPALEFTPAIAPASGMFYRGNAFQNSKEIFSSAACAAKEFSASNSTARTSWARSGSFIAFTRASATSRKAPRVTSISPPPCTTRPKVSRGPATT
jgi:glucose/arabinose dehydrogenase